MKYTKLVGFPLECAKDQLVADGIKEIKVVCTRPPNKEILPSGDPLVVRCDALDEGSVRLVVAFHHYTI